MFPQSFGVNPFQAYAGINPFTGINPFLSGAGPAGVGINPFVAQQTGFGTGINPAIPQLALVNPALVSALLAQTSLASPFSAIGGHSIGPVGAMNPTINPLINPLVNPVIAGGSNPGLDPGVFGHTQQFSQQTQGVPYGQINPLVLLAQQQLPIRSLVSQPFDQQGFERQGQGVQFSGINPLAPIIQAHLASQMINPWQHQGLNPWQHQGLNPLQQGYTGGFVNPLQALTGYAGVFGQPVNAFCG